MWYTKAMRVEKYIRFLLLPGLLLGGLFGFISFTFATGISPSTIESGRLTKTATFSDEFRITNSEIDKKRAYSVRVEGFGSEYVKLSRRILEFSEGARSVGVEFTLDVRTAPNGTYDVFLVAEPATKIQARTRSGQSVDAQSGAVGRIHFEVTGQEVHDADVRFANVQPAQAGSPVQLEFEIANRGTVDFRFSEVLLEVFDESGVSVVTSTIDTSKVRGVSPRKQKSLVLTSDLLLDAGEYELAILAKYDVDNVVSKSALLRVYPEGILSQSGKIRDVLLSSSQLKKGEKVKIEVVVENTGTSNYVPSAKLEVFKGKTKVETFSLTKDIPFSEGQRTTFTTLYTPPSRGAYALLATMNFGVDMKDTHVVRFQVGGVIYQFFAATFAFLGDPVVRFRFFSVFGFVLLIILGAFVLVRRKRETPKRSQNGVEVKGPSMQTVLPDIPTIDVRPSEDHFLSENEDAQV